MNIKTVPLRLSILACLISISPCLASIAGRLYLDIIPTTATCSLDGKQVDPSQPLILEYGTYDLKVEHTFYPIYMQKIKIEKDSTYVGVFPLQIKFSPVDARVYIDDRPADYREADRVYSLAASGQRKIRACIGRVSKEMSLMVNGSTEGTISLNPRPMLTEGMFTCYPEIAWYPESGVVALHTALLLVASEGRYGKTSFHWGLSVFDGAIGSPESYFLSLGSLEAGINYNTNYSYERFSLGYKLYLMPWNAGSKAHWVAHDMSISEYHAYAVYRIEDAWCVLKSTSAVRHRFTAGYTRFFDHGLSLSLSLGLAANGFYKWYRADNWNSPEDDRTYLAEKEIKQISPFIEGVQPFISLTLRYNLLHSRRQL